MKKPHHVDPLVISSLAERYLAGETLTQIGDSIDRHHTWVANRLRAFGIELRPQGIKSKIRKVIVTCRCARCGLAEPHLCINAELHRSHYGVEAR